MENRKRGCDKKYPHHEERGTRSRNKIRFRDREHGSTSRPHPGCVMPSIKCLELFLSIYQCNT